MSIWKYHTVSEPYISLDYGCVLYDPRSDGFVCIAECKMDCSMIFCNLNELEWADRWDENSFKLLYQAARASEKLTLDTYVLVPFREKNGNDMAVNFSYAISVEYYMDV